MTAKTVLLFSSLMLIAACDGVDVKQQEIGPIQDKVQRDIDKAGKLGGGDGLLNELLRGGKNSGGGTGIGVNAYLWQASLDTLSFLPLASADSFGGIIITDWYVPDANVSVRYKLNVYVIGRELRADGLRVVSFKQKLEGTQWVDIAENAAVNIQLEDAILTRARQMRIDSNAVTE